MKGKQSNGKTFVPRVLELSNGQVVVDGEVEVNSDSQLYKQAGNSIVVQVLEAIFKEML